MEQLIFLAIIVIFSIIDSVARTRKKRRAGAPTESQQIPQEWEDDVETYDADPSYDDRYAAEEATATLPDRDAGYGSQRSTAPSSEGMIPADIWEEIAGLSRGRVPAPEPPPMPPVPVETIPPRPVEAHRVHRAHAGYGTDPSSRAKSEQDGLDPLRHTLSRDAQSVRRQLQSHRKSALRRAVLLQEILGPPAASRPEAFRD